MAMEMAVRMTGAPAHAPALSIAGRARGPHAGGASKRTKDISLIPHLGFRIWAAPGIGASTAFDGPRSAPHAEGRSTLVPCGIAGFPGLKWSPGLKWNIDRCPGGPLKEAENPRRR